MRIHTCYFCIYPEWLAVVNRRLHNVIDLNAVSDRLIYGWKIRLALPIVPSKWVNRNYSVPMQLRRPKSSMVDTVDMVQLPIAIIHTNTAAAEMRKTKNNWKIFKRIFDDIWHQNKSVIDFNYTYLCHIFNILWNIIGHWVCIEENSCRWYTQIECEHLQDELFHA